MSINLPRNNISIFLFDLSQIGLLLSLIGASFGITSINSIGVWLIFSSVLGLTISGIRKRYIERPFLYVILIGGFSLISIFLAGQISYQALVSLFSFIEIPIIIVMTKPLKSDRRIKSAAVFSLLSMVVYMIAYYSPRSHYFLTIYGERTIKDLTLGFSNPNETGMHLMATLFVLLTCIFFYKRYFQKTIFFIASIIAISFIFMTLSRSSIIICILMLIVIVPTIKSQKISKKIQILVLCSPFIILTISLIFSNFFSNIIFLNDALDTGRTAIYLQRLGDLSIIQWIFGNYSYLFQNSLNAYLSVLVTIGIVPLFLYINVLKLGLNKCNDNSVNSFNRVAFMGILMTIIHASIESANLVSGSFYAASFFSIYAIALDRQK